MLVEGKLGKNNALKLAGAKQASALLIFSHLVFGLISRTTPIVGECSFDSPANRRIALDRPAQRPWPRTPPHPRLPQQAGQLGSLGVPGPGKQALPNAPLRPAPVHLPLRPTCLPRAPVHHGPPQHRQGAITLPSAAAARLLCLNPVLLDTRRGGGASGLPMPTAAPPATTPSAKNADGCANGTVAALPRPYA